MPAKIGPVGAPSFNLAVWSIFIDCSLAPAPSCGLYVGPALLGPSGKRQKRLLKGAREVSELVQGGGLNPVVVDLTGDQTVALNAAKSFGEHLVRYAASAVCRSW
jgi:hypothetical protein